EPKVAGGVVGVLRGSRRRAAECRLGHFEQTPARIGLDRDLHSVGLDDRRDRTVGIIVVRRDVASSIFYGVDLPATAARRAVVVRELGDIAAGSFNRLKLPLGGVAQVCGPLDDVVGSVALFHDARRQLGVLWIAVVEHYALVLPRKVAAGTL